MLQKEVCQVVIAILQGIDKELVILCPIAEHIFDYFAMDSTNCPEYH